jgi:hypothetical protein
MTAMRSLCYIESRSSRRLSQQSCKANKYRAATKRRSRLVRCLPQVIANASSARKLPQAGLTKKTVEHCFSAEKPSGLRFKRLFFKKHIEL